MANKKTMTVAEISVDIDIKNERGIITLRDTKIEVEFEAISGVDFGRILKVLDITNLVMDAFGFKKEIHNNPVVDPVPTKKPKDPKKTSPAIDKKEPVAPTVAPIVEKKKRGPYGQPMIFKVQKLKTEKECKDLINHVKKRKSNLKYAKKLTPDQEKALNDTLEEIESRKKQIYEFSN